MKVEYKREINSPKEQLIYEINERVNKHLEKGNMLSKLDVEVLKIDKESLKNYSSLNFDKTVSTNLTKKIDLLLNEKE